MMASFNDSEPYVVKETKVIRAAFGKRKVVPLTKQDVATEWIAYQIYALCGAKVPSAYLLHHNFHQFYIATTYFEHFKPIRELLKKPKNKYLFQQEAYRKSLISILAGAVLSLDWDVVGKGLNNIGYTKTHPIIKIDPGAANFNPQSEFKPDTNLQNGFLLESFTNFGMNEYGYNLYPIFQYVTPDDKKQAALKICKFNLKSINILINSIPKLFLTDQEKKVIYLTIVKRVQSFRALFKQPSSSLKKRLFPSLSCLGTSATTQVESPQVLIPAKLYDKSHFKKTDKQLPEGDSEPYIHMARLRRITI